MKLPGNVIAACGVGLGVSLPITLSAYFHLHPGLSTTMSMVLMVAAIVSFPAMFYGVMRWSKSRVAEGVAQRAARIEAYRQSPESHILRLS